MLYLDTCGKEIPGEIQDVIELLQTRGFKGSVPYMLHLANVLMKLEPQLKEKDGQVFYGSRVIGYVRARHSEKS